MIAETERLGEDIRQELVAEPVLRARLDVGCRPEADLLERAQVHERVILVELPERRFARGNDVAQGLGAKPAIGGDRHDNGAGPARQPRTARCRVRLAPSVGWREEQAHHRPVEQDEGRDDQIGEDQLALVEQAPHRDHVVARDARRRQRQPGVAADGADDARAIEQDGEDAGRAAGADREPDAAGEAADRVVEGQGPGSGEDMDEDQRQDHRRRREKSECRLCRKDRRLDEQQDRRRERDDTA